MKKSYLSVAFAACAFAGAALWLAVTAPSAMAQQGQGIPPQVYLVDVALIFKNDPTLKARMEEMKHDIEAVQKELNARTEALKKHAEMLQTLTAGTPDYRNLEEQLVKEKAGIQGDMQLRKKDMALREARNYFNAYTAIHAEVEAYCTQYRIPLVLTFNSEKINPENPDDVLRAINGKVLYNSSAIDLTPFIMDRIKRSSGVANNMGNVVPQGVNVGGGAGQPMQQNPNYNYNQPR